MKKHFRVGSNARIKAIETARKLEKLAANSCHHARRYRVKVRDRLLGATDTSWVPETITILVPDCDDSTRHQLFLGCLSVETENWTHNRAERSVSWRSGQAGATSGFVRFGEGAMRGHGFIQHGAACCTVQLDTAPASYTCDFGLAAPNQPDPAEAIAGGGGVTLTWNTSSAGWQNAVWQNGILDFSYDVTSQVILGQNVYVVNINYQDLATDIPWSPGQDTFTVSLDQSFRFAFDLMAGYDPGFDPRSGGPVADVYPYVLQFQFDPAANTFQGAVLTGQNSPQGEVYAVRGTLDNTAIVGVYQLEGAAQPLTIAVENGRVTANGAILPKAVVRGNRIVWSALPAELVPAGLPSSGFLEFSVDGAALTAGTGVKSGKRLNPTEVASLPAWRPSPVAAAAGPAPLPYGPLMNMSQYQQDSQLNWYDIVQQGAAQDFYAIMQNFMDATLRQQFISLNPPALTPTVFAISTLAGTDGIQAQAWYRQVSVPYLVNALSTFDDPYAKDLNAIRAQKWLTSSMSQSSVYKKQMPLLYANRWNLLWSEFEAYRQDQTANAAAYASLIGNDAAAWKSTLAGQIFDPATLAAVQSQIDQLSRQASQTGQYYAYLIYRLQTSSSGLDSLQAASLSSSDGMQYTRHMQTYCALQNFLDSTGAFAQAYTSAVEIFQLSNVLPTLFDYSGNTQDCDAMTLAIIQQFISQYQGSSDPEMQQTADQLQQAVSNNQVQQVMDAFHSIASDISGVSSWEELAAKFQKALPTVLPGVPGNIATVITLAAGAAGVVAFVLGVQNFGSMSGDERTEVIASGVESFTELTVALVKRGLTYVTIFQTENTPWQAFSTIFTEDARSIAETRLSNAFGKWLLQNGEEEESEIFGNLFRESVDEDLTLTAGIFGRNLDEFVATRLGAVFAVVGIVTSAIALADSTDPLDTAGNALLLSSSSLELFATAGAWALGAIGVEEIGGLAIATIACACSVVAAFAAIAGTIVLLVLAYIQEHEPVKTPVQIFAQGTANDNGYYMALGADIDCLRVYQNPDEIQMVGTAFQPAGISGSCLRIGSGGALSLAPQTNNYATALLLTVNAAGQAQIGTPVQTGTGLDMYLLTVDQNKNLTAQPPLPAAQASQQLWTANITGGIVWDGANLQQARFFLANAYWIGQKVVCFLQASDGQVTVGVGANPPSWSLAMVPMAPAGLTMQNIALYGYQRDLVFYPALAQNGSAPQQWSISPVLPAFLTLDPGTGQISQVTGVAPVPMAAQSYTISVSNALATQSASFSIQVTGSATQSMVA